VNSPGDVPPYELPDDRLLAQYRLEAFVSSGPGRQEQNRHSPKVLCLHQLLVGPDATLNLHEFDLYTYYRGAPHLVLAGEGGQFGEGTIIDSSGVPDPLSPWLLAGELSGTVEMRRRRSS
jgi:hypothetical protein